MIPVIVIASLQIGAFVLNKDIGPNSSDILSTFKNHLFEYVVGSFILAAISAFIIGFGSYFLLLKSKRK